MHGQRAKMYKVINPPKVDIIDTIQYIHRRILNGDYDPCPHCNGTGRHYFIDSAGSKDYENCAACGGWSVLQIQHPNRNWE